MVKRHDPQQRRHPRIVGIPELGAYVKERRLAKGLSQDQLARRVGRTQNYISRLENAGPDYPLPDGETVTMLAGELDTTVRYLLKIAGYEPEDSADLPGLDDPFVHFWAANSDKLTPKIKEALMEIASEASAKVESS